MDEERLSDNVRLYKGTAPGDAARRRGAGKPGGLILTLKV